MLVSSSSGLLLKKIIINLLLLYIKVRNSLILLYLASIIYPYIYKDNLLL